MSTQREIGVGVAGLGFIGRIHLEAYAAARRDGHPCRVVAVCDRDPQRREGLASDGGNIGPPAAGRLFDPRDVRAYDEFDALLADEAVELVSICTYTDTHVDLAVRALRAGKHVLVEKPLARTSAEAARLREAADAADTLCMPAMCMRFWPGWGWLKARIDDGALGRVRSAVFTRLGAAPGWSSGFYEDYDRSGGALLDLHIHDVDFLRWCFGEPREVAATGSLRHVTTLYRYDDGPEHVAAEGGWIGVPGFPFRMRYRVEFEQAAAEFDSLRDPPLMLYHDGRGEAVPLEAGTGYDGQVRHLLARITSGKGPLRATVAEAQAVLRLLEAERRSLESGAAVDVTSDR